MHNSELIPILAKHIFQRLSCRHSSLSVYLAHGFIPHTTTTNHLCCHPQGIYYSPGLWMWQFYSTQQIELSKSKKDFVHFHNVISLQVVSTCTLSWLTSTVHRWAHLSRCGYRMSQASFSSGTFSVWFRCPGWSSSFDEKLKFNDSNCITSTVYLHSRNWLHCLAEV